MWREEPAEESGSVSMLVTEENTGEKWWLQRRGLKEEKEKVDAEPAARSAHSL